MTCRRAAAIAPAVQGRVGIIKDGRGFGLYDPTTDRLTLQSWPDRPLRWVLRLDNPEDD